MSKIFPLAFCAVFFVGCGQNIVPPVSKKLFDASVTCPKSLRQPQEELTIFFGTPPPGRIAIDIAGQRKYSECTTLRTPPPIVGLERLPGNRLSIKLQRLENRRVDEILFSVKNLHDCSGAPEGDLVKDEHAAIRYVMEFPDGPNCPGQPVARMDLVR
jgi:hypothetical protein